MRVGPGLEGGDSNSCRDEDRKRRAVVFVAIGPHPQRHDGNVLMRDTTTPGNNKTVNDVITFPQLVAFIVVIEGEF